MKKFIIIRSIPLLALLYGCAATDLDGAYISDNQDREIIISRSGESAIFSCEKGGLFVVQSETLTDNILIDNAVVINTPDNFRISGTEPFYWPFNSSKLDFIMYFPFQVEAVVDKSFIFQVEQDQSDVEAYERSAYYYAKNQGVSPIHSCWVDMQFKNLMGQLSVTCVPGNTFKYVFFEPDSVKLYLENVATNSLISLSTGNAEAGDQNGNIIPLRTDNFWDYATFTMYLPPQSLTEDAKFKIIYRGEEMVGSLPMQVESGKTYFINIVLNRDGISADIPNLPVVQW